MTFDPNNKIIQFCVQGMAAEEKGENKEALTWFLKAWDEATNDFEKFIAAYYVARRQKQTTDKLEWLETALEFALKVNDTSTRTALPALYLNISECYGETKDSDKEQKYLTLADSSKTHPFDDGPFYHGTRANLQIGDLLLPGGTSNYKSGFRMNHIYFTALVNGAGFAAALAKGDGRERVYIVEPTGPFESDPNLTDKKFPGNPSRSYRSDSPLKIVGEVTEWSRVAPEELEKWRKKLENNKGEIIN